MKFILSLIVVVAMCSTASAQCRSGSCGVAQNDRVVTYHEVHFYGDHREFRPVRGAVRATGKVVRGVGRVVTFPVRAVGRVFGKGRGGCG